MTRKTQFASTAMALALMASVAGCTGASKATRSPAPAPATTTVAGDLSGKVVETMDAGGYTYICLEKNAQRIWVAAPVMKVALGQELKFLSGAVMTNFSSKALNRTFDKIVFSGGLDTAADAQAPAAKKGDYQEVDQEILTGKIIETMDASNYTYILVEKDGKAAWSAVPTYRVKVGDEVEVQPGTPMGQFTSKMLGRTFNSIYFASGVKVTKPAPEAADKGAAKAGSDKPAAAAATAAPAVAADAAAKPGSNPALPSGHPKIDMEAAKKAAQAAQQAQAPAAAPITGKVVEVADGGGYTYICLEKNGEKTWVATQPMQVTVGQELALNPGVVMTNFASRTLNRTFEKIIFTDGLAGK